VSKNKINIFNPLNEDFSVKYDVKKDKPITFTIKAKEVAEFEEYIAKHIKKHLANRIFDVKGDYKKDRDMQMKKFYKEMEVK
jgi:hypothetical protein